jgi:hypothetical protein
MYFECVTRTLLKRVSIIEGFEPTVFEPKSLFSNSEGIELLIFNVFQHFSHFYRHFPVRVTINRGFKLPQMRFCEILTISLIFSSFVVPSNYGTPNYPLKNSTRLVLFILEIPWIINHCVAPSSGFNRRNRLYRFFPIVLIHIDW